MDIKLRPAAPDDAGAVARLHLQCHEEAYGRHLPADVFARRRETLPERITWLRESMEAGSIPTLAYDDSGLIGIANAGPARDGDGPAGTELFLIYILARTYGSGAGQRLLDSVIGAEAAYLWVLEDNPRAQAFYARNGFALDGERKLLPETWHRLPEVRMVRRTVQQASTTLAR